MKTRTKCQLALACSVLALLVSIGIGSVLIVPSDILRIFANRLFGTALPVGMNPVYPGLVMDIRLPRVLLAFLVGAALAVSGAVMQSVLKNPLASSYGLGVSSGAGLGAALVMIFGLSSGALGALLLPAAGLVFGLATVVLAIAFASRVDRSLSNSTIILTGMVLSLFLNAIMTLIASTSPEYSYRILLWQLGSFSM
ncbi:MAG: iron chelate uptake ABC transporter family permease subunit, partial [Ruthenibacterium sp.]